MGSNVQRGMWPCVTMLQRGSVRKGRVGGWGCWWGGGEREREREREMEEVYSCSLLGFDLCFFHALAFRFA